MLKNRGLAMPIVLCMILCTGIWLASLSWSMTNSRARFQHLIRLRSSYYLARSALQHFFLKVKFMQRNYPETVLLLETSPEEDLSRLTKAFVEDIIQPGYAGENHKGEYGIIDFSIGSIDHDRGAITMEILAQGSFEGTSESIRRVQRISR